MTYHAEDLFRAFLVSYMEWHCVCVRVYVCVQVRGQPGHNTAFPSARQSVLITQSQQKLIHQGLATNPLAFREGIEWERIKAREWQFYTVNATSLSVKKTWQREGEKRGQKETAVKSTEMPA